MTSKCECCEKETINVKSLVLCNYCFNYLNDKLKLLMLENLFLRLLLDEKREEGVNEKEANKNE
jgi:hypothetical protein